MSGRRAITVVGIGDDGCLSLSSRAMSAVAAAQVLVGGERHLAFFPQFSGVPVVLKNGLASALDRIAELANEHNVCVLASGDPMFFGIGALLIKRLGVEHVEIIPHPSSMQLAFARAGLKWDDAVFISVHGRGTEGFLTRLGSASKVAVFTDEENSPARLARLMAAHGEAGWKAWVCENLAGPGERVRTFSVQELASCADIAPLNLLILARTEPSWRPPPVIPFLREDEFARRMPDKGLITKREVRLFSLAAMCIRPDSVVWDVGAASGSVSVEAAMLAPLGRVYAVEANGESVEICKENLRAHAVDNVRVIEGRAPEALDGLEAPDAVFVGGSGGRMEEIVDLALKRLRPGGRLVVNAITLENSGEVYGAMRRHGVVPDVTLLQVSRAEPLARYLRFQALNPIQIFTAEKPAAGGTSE